jgi:hypothetical protein
VPHQLEEELVLSPEKAIAADLDHLQDNALQLPQLGGMKT